ncbi:MAG: helix-turn-helix domain-containing protein [Pseudomonadota bacterium]
MTARTDAGLTRGYATVVATGQAFTAYHLSDKSGLSVTTIYRHLRDWIKQGKVVKLAERRGGRQLYQASPGEIRSIEHARAADPYQNMWFVMRKSGGPFRPEDVAAYASVGKVEISASDAADYCWFLDQAGYLIIVERGRQGLTDRTYRLIKDTGPRAPRPEWRLAAFDPNVGRVTFADGMSVR